MKVVIAPDSFKGTMSSIEACDIIEKAILDTINNADIVKIPVADGGEGLVEAILAVNGGKRIYLTVQGPNFTPVDAYYGILTDGVTAVIEMASASGIIIADTTSTPWDTTTIGTGQLIMHAIDSGCKKIILGIGGSATNDAGIGMASAFGVRFLDSSGNEVSLTGGGLDQLHTIDTTYLDKRLANIKMVVACDVNNPLYGDNGAAFVYAPQKGADAEMVRKLDNNLRKFAKILSDNIGISVDEIPGTGAAGGMAACIIPFINAELKPGIDIVLDYANFDDVITNADFIITGEGKIDAQSLSGKVAIGISRRASKKNTPVIVVAGDVTNINKNFYEQGITAVFSTNQIAAPYSDIKPYCRQYLYETVSNIIRVYIISHNNN